MCPVEPLEGRCVATRRERRVRGLGVSPGQIPLFRQDVLSGSWLVVHIRFDGGI